MLDREETRKRDRERRRRKIEEEEEIQCKNTWVKYSLGLRHQVITYSMRHLCIFFQVFAFHIVWLFSALVGFLQIVAIFDNCFLPDTIFICFVDSFSPFFNEILIRISMKDIF